VTGRVEQGIVKVGEEVEVVGLRTVCISGFGLAFLLQIK